MMRFLNSRGGVGFEIFWESNSSDEVSKFEVWVGFDIFQPWLLAFLYVRTRVLEILMMK